MVPENPILSVREQIADHIRSDILSGQFKEGTMLREEPLRKRFGVGRGPVRDALLQLAQEGLLISLPNRGVKVGSAPDKKIQPLVVELRKRIEVYALIKIFENIKKKHINKLQSLVESLKTACKEKDLATVAKLDMAFHRQILEFSDSSDLISIWQPIVARMMLQYTRHEDMMENYKEHQAILDAIKNKDLQTALTALEQNIQ